MSGTRIVAWEERLGSSEAIEVVSRPAGGGWELVPLDARGRPLGKPDSDLEQRLQRRSSEPGDEPGRDGDGRLAVVFGRYLRGRIELPAAVRTEARLGATAWASLAVVATPDSAQGCTTPGVVTHKLKLKVVRVLSSARAGVS